MAPSARLLVASVALSLMIVSPASAAGGRTHLKRPDLVVAIVDLAVDNGNVTGVVTVRNQGTRSAGRTVTAVGSEHLLTPALAPHHHAVLQVATTVPAAGGSLTVCADAYHQVRELTESDDCQVFDVPDTTHGTVTPSPSASPTPHPTTPTPIAVSAG